MTKSKVISVVHPTRNRVSLFEATLNNWMQKCSNPKALEYIVSIDESETVINYFGYKHVIQKANEKFGSSISLLISPNTCCVQAVNSGAEAAKGDLIIVNSDDFDCPDKWDEILVTEGFLSNHKPQVFLIDDGLSKDIVSLPILNRLAYTELGYVYYPEFISMFADNDLYENAKQKGWLENRRDIRFQHVHYTFTKQEPDEAYKRQNSSRSWKIGEQLFKERCASNFSNVSAIVYQDTDNHSQNQSDFTSHPNLKGITQVRNGGFCN